MTEPTARPAQPGELPFKLQGPDSDGEVWLHIGEDSINLGQWEDVAERFCQWLGEIDYLERP